MVTFKGLQKWDIPTILNKGEQIIPTILNKGGQIIGLEEWKADYSRNIEVVNKLEELRAYEWPSTKLIDDWYKQYCLIEEDRPEEE